MTIDLGSFQPPENTILEGICLEFLSAKHADLDFAAVRASADAIRYVFGPESDWPSPAITYDDNLADLARHEREFCAREAYAYALRRATDGAYLGCFYLVPLKTSSVTTQQFAARAYLWLSVLHSSLEVNGAMALLDNWLTSTWGLRAVAWPGRRIPWSEWQKL